jgi:hypothetical protein
MQTESGTIVGESDNSELRSVTFQHQSHQQQWQDALLARQEWLLLQRCTPVPCEHDPLLV